MAEFLDIDKVLKELNISEADLTKLVSEGELIAFKDETTQKLKFLSSDVSKLKEEIKGKIYLTLEEVEKLANIQKDKIMDMVSEGRLQAYKDPNNPQIIKFRKSDVVKLAKKEGVPQAQLPKEQERVSEVQAKAAAKMPQPPVQKQPPAIEPAKASKESKLAEKETKEKKVEIEQKEEDIDLLDIPKVNIEPKKDVPAEMELPIEQKEQQVEEENGFLTPKEVGPKEDSIDDLTIDFKDETKELPVEDTLSTSTEETDVDLGSLLEDTSTTKKEVEEEEETEVVAKKPTIKPKVVSVEEVGYEDNPLDIVLLFLTAVVLVAVGFFVYDSFNVLQYDKIVYPSDFTKQMGQQVSSLLGAKDIDLEKALAGEKIKIGGEKKRIEPPTEFKGKKEESPKDKKEHK
jgi:hypothetical protein